MSTATPGPEYVINRATQGVAADARWENSFWGEATTAEIANFRVEGSSHRPRARVKLLYDGEGLHGIFHVHDQYVRSIRTAYQDPVWRDSCVEFFVEPKPSCGYFNFEFNCAGVLLCSHVTNPERTQEGLKAATPVPVELGRLVRIQSSMPPVVSPEIQEPVDWTLRVFIPYRLMESFVGAVAPGPGQPWRGNFFKCADDSSHPHWAAWSAVDELNFHLPRCFGTLRFGGEPAEAARA